MIASRRSFLTGLGASLILAPAIVRASSLMPVNPMLVAPPWSLAGAFQIEGYAAAAEIEHNAWVSHAMGRPETISPGHFIKLHEQQNKIVEYSNSKWQFQDDKYDRPVIVTLRDGAQWQRRKGLIA